MVGCFNSDAKKQLLQKAQLELDEFVALVHTVESSEQDLCLLQNTNTSSASVHKLFKGAHSQNKKASQGKQQFRQNSSTANGGKQRNVQQPRYAAGSDVCSACGKKGPPVLLQAMSGHNKTVQPL